MLWHNKYFDSLWSALVIAFYIMIDPLLRIEFIYQTPKSALGLHNEDGKELIGAIHNCFFFSMHTLSPPPIDLTWQKLKILYLK